MNDGLLQRLHEDPTKLDLRGKFARGRLGDFGATMREAARKIERYAEAIEDLTDKIDRLQERLDEVANISEDRREALDRVSLGLTPGETDGQAC